MFRELSFNFSGTVLWMSCVVLNRCKSLWLISSRSSLFLITCRKINRTQLVVKGPTTPLFLAKLSGGQAAFRTVHDEIVKGSFDGPVKRVFRPNSRRV